MSSNWYWNGCGSKIKVRFDFITIRWPKIGSDRYFCMIQERFLTTCPLKIGQLNYMRRWNKVKSAFYRATCSICATYAKTWSANSQSWGCQHFSETPNAEDQLKIKSWINMKKSVIQWQIKCSVQITVFIRVRFWKVKVSFSWVFEKFLNQDSLLRWSTNNSSSKSRLKDSKSVKDFKWPLKSSIFRF